MNTPFEFIKKKLADELPSELLNIVPDKWEKIGDVLVLKLDNKLSDYKKIIGENYAKFLNCKTVLNDIGGITGILRKPDVEIIFGSSDTVTVHKENNVRYRLDPQKVMFSSGNMDERKRMSSISKPGETVVDMFAGIGYFTLPIAVHSKPQKIFACEKNPVSFDFLRENIVLNNVVDIVEPLLGDNRTVVPRGVADRVIMEYIGDTQRFLPAAFRCLRNYGVVHFHDKYPEKKVPKDPLETIKKEAEKYNLKTELLEYRRVKSFAPGISHYVFDIKVENK
jgi:tRNA wybutosine-synthesizing protein 2